MGTMKALSFLPGVGTKRTRSYLGKPKKHTNQTVDNFPQNFVCVYLYLSFIEVSSVTCLMICFMCFLHLKFRDAVGGFTQKFLWIPIVFDPPKLPLRVTHPQKLGETHGSNWLRSLRDKPVIGNLLMWQRWHQQIPTVTTNRVISPPTLQAKRVSRAACHLSTWVHFVISLGVLLSENF